MKKYPFILIFILIAAVLGGVLILKKKPPSQNKEINTSIVTTPTPEKLKNVLNTDIFRGPVDLCKIFPQEKVSQILGKTILKSEKLATTEQTFSEVACVYYLEEMRYSQEPKANITKNVSIGIVQGATEKIRTPVKQLNWTVKEDNEIPFENRLIFDEKNNLRTLFIILEDNLDLRIDVWWSNLSNEERLKFVKSFANYLNGVPQDLFGLKGYQSSQEIPSPTESQGTTSTQEEEVIRKFTGFIDEGKPEEAVSLMKVANDSEKQAWAVQFAAIDSFKILKIEKSRESGWTPTKHFYKLTLDVKMNPSSANAPIPYYGWNNGEDTRFITLEKSGDLWQISEIATGY